MAWVDEAQQSNPTFQDLNHGFRSPNHHPMITLMVTLTGKSRFNHAKTLSRDDKVDERVHDEMMMANGMSKRKKKWV